MTKYTKHLKLKKKKCFQVKYNFYAQKYFMG